MLYHEYMNLPEDKLKGAVLEKGYVDKESLAKVEAFAKSAGISLAAALIEESPITDEQLGAIVADLLGVPFIVLSKITIPPDVAHIIPDKLARKKKAIVFARDKEGVKVAMQDPTDKELLSSIARKTGLKVFSYYATENDLDRVIQLHKKVLQKSIDELLEDIKKNKNGVMDDAPVIKIVNELIYSAFLDKASDIHIEPTDEQSLVRFRIDGVLQDVLKLPQELHDRAISRIKVLSNLRTDEHQSAQDGKMRMSFPGEDIDIRVSIVPIVEGEKAVLRLLTSTSGQHALGDLGFTDVDLAKINRAINKSFGMILSTGPTGSGKTTSVYAVLKILNTRGKNITTIEDPVEYRIKGANQIQVNTKTKLTFAKGLRSILRQDPDIILVGEIRDSETAKIGVNAALTGHLVLSTLHTNDAATATVRLTDMKVEPFLVASTVNVIIAQRLVRKICDYCKTQRQISSEELVKNIPSELIKKYFSGKKTVQTYKGEGCKICHGTGYSGRIGIFEVLEVSKNLRKLIVEKSDADVIGKAAMEEGMMSMLENGLLKVIEGSTTIEEVMRVTKVEMS